MNDTEDTILLWLRTDDEDRVASDKTTLGKSRTASVLREFEESKSRSQSLSRTTGHHIPRSCTRNTSEATLMEVDVDSIFQTAFEQPQSSIPTNHAKLKNELSAPAIPILSNSSLFSNGQLQEHPIRTRTLSSTSSQQSSTIHSQSRIPTLSSNKKSMLNNSPTKIPSPSNNQKQNDAFIAPKPSALLDSSSKQNQNASPFPRRFKTASGASVSFVSRTSSTQSFDGLLGVSAVERRGGRS
ncbi:hypothetical protein BCR33DRAFT_718964 [Rhizoclosmatium globosum]|uniref:Uncharacterized protein n=1 Tax=Rhizoclosmatium globosum TaxID=329046 RepID=A0A1Y2C388_9FUNG|nr:hypothetical protein BCR33DRAFT_718964 [Rhizoclosmatium globosum]|eukprot:ORY41354.1 hypothetical protein BCR33DRAFT_718964 [Rhizoclosmatium globosum]